MFQTFFKEPKVKKRRKGINRAGKGLDQNGKALRIQTEAFKRVGLYYRCEKCGQSGPFLAFAHTKKRDDCSPEELIYAVARLCVLCHDGIEMPGDHVAMEAEIRAIILNRGVETEFFRKAKQVVRKAR